MARAYLVALCLADKLCLVVGGGQVAARKVHSLLEAGARVRVVAPRLRPELQELAMRGDIAWEPRGVVPGDLIGAFLVVAAADDPATNDLVGRLARQAGVLANVVDQPDLCNFYVPATFRRGPVSVAVSTDGTSPLLARRLREELEQRVGAEWGELAELLAGFRQQLPAHCPDLRTRAEKWATLPLAPVLARLRAGRREEATDLIREHLEGKGASPCSEET